MSDRCQGPIYSGGPTADRRLARSGLIPIGSPAIAHFLGLGNRDALWFDLRPEAPRDGAKWLFTNVTTGTRMLSSRIALALFSISALRSTMIWCRRGAHRLARGRVHFRYCHALRTFKQFGWRLLLSPPPLSTEAGEGPDRGQLRASVFQGALGKSSDASNFARLGSSWRIVSMVSTASSLRPRRCRMRARFSRASKRCQAATTISRT
jgi:hypothetical protein